jgi:site-specific recombinase XerD
MTQKNNRRTDGSKLRQLIDYYEICNRSEGKSPKTIQWYTANLTQFEQYLRCRHNSTNIEKIDLKILREYVLYLLNKTKGNSNHSSISKQQLSPMTVHGHVRTLKAFFSWLVKESLIDQNPAAGLKPPKLPHKVITILSDDEIRTILSTFNPKNPIDTRNQVIIMILLDTGLRIKELTGLRMGDLYLKEGIVKVIGKGQRERIVPIGAVAQRSLNRYLFRFRPKPIHAATDNVFLTQVGHPLTENCIKLMFTRLAKHLGITRLHAHLCRHTFATKYLANGGDVFSLQQILGHSSLEMVRRYANLTSNQIVMRHQQFSPLDRVNLGAS